MSNDIKPFDVIWNEAENLSSQVNKSYSTDYVMKEIEEICSDIRGNIDALNATASEMLHKKEIQAALTHKLVGKLLFMLTTITARENINVYTALQDQVKNILAK